ncbi:MAG: hypothetical protein QF805_30590, partial [Pirellulaceae bacterium]|nr:hypothetical protein [Pirellulaceae bacterium]
CRVGGYHSLLAVSDKIPDQLQVLARNEEDMVMAVRHKSLPIAAVQFHPEFKSKPTKPQPLFAGFVAAAISRHAQKERSPAPESQV